MTDIQFQEEQEFQRSAQPEELPFFVRFVITTGAASSKKQAEYVLIGFAVVALLAAFFVVPFLLGPKPGKPILRPGMPISAPAHPS